MINSPYEKYRQSSVKTSTPSQLLIMLFDGAIRFVRAGMEGIDSVDYQKTNINLGKAQTIVSELMSTLDPTYDISKSLYDLYEYINHLLIQANVKKDKVPAEEALQYLTEFRLTWLEASKLVPAHENTMDNCILELNKITQDIINRLDNCSYEELNDFVEQRQNLIDQLEQQVRKQSIGVIEQHQLRELLEADPMIIARMQQLKSEAAKWLQQREHTKTQRNAYDTAYTPDSFLMDRKK